MGLLLLMEWQTTAWQVSGKKDNDKSYFFIFIFICRYVVFWLEIIHPMFFFIFCSLPQKYTLVPEAFLEFFLFMKERANSEAETTSCKVVRREEKTLGPG